LSVGVFLILEPLYSSVLQLRQEFLNALNLAAIDVISVKVWLDRKVRSCSPFLFSVQPILFWVWTKCSF